MDILTQIEKEKEIKGSVFGGRISRSDFFVFQIVVWMIGYLGVVILVFNKYFNSLMIGLDKFSIMIGLIIILVSVFYGLVVLPIKRLHDFDLSGSYVVLLLVPGINLIFILYIFSVRGMMEDNSYGKKEFIPNQNIFERYSKPMLFFILIFLLIVLNYQFVRSFQ